MHSQRTGLIAWLPVGLLMRDRFETEAKASGIPHPVLIVHGEADDLIPVAMGHRLVKAFPNASIQAIAGRGHNDVLEEAGLVGRLAEFALLRN